MKRILIPALIALGLTAAACGISVGDSTATDSCTVPQVVAHRGGWADVGRTEDTVGAYVKAATYGLLEWETDIRFDRNNVPYLMHDATIDRTTKGTGQASSVNIATTTVKMNDGTALKDQGLARLLSYASHYEASVSIEPKVAATSSQVTRVLALLDTYGMRDRVLFESFRTANLAPFKTAAPNLTYALVVATAVSPATAAGVGSVLYVADAMLTQPLVDAYHAAGVKVYAWTPDTPTQWAAHRSLGIDRFVSDNPVKYRAWRDAVCTGGWIGSY
jgi:glycerophosphoryl diester phosphodiesterase